MIVIENLDGFGVVRAAGGAGRYAAYGLMSIPVRRIREDFDRIALLTERHGGAGDLYHPYLLRHLPPRAERALEIGCGTGAFTRLLASRARSVLAVDLSPQMIRLARKWSAGYANIEYLLGDVMRLSLPSGGYDCVVSLAALHHLPLRRALLKMKAALRPNGTLIIHDLVADDRLVDKIMAGLAWPVGGAWRVWRTGRLRASKEVREAWAAHGRDETYLRMNEVREMCRQYLPGAQVRRHLLWRYTVIWHHRAAA